jgi:hypothetical protein
LGLRIELDFSVVLPDGSQLMPAARLPDLGAPKGMLVFRSYREIQPITKIILETGYGFSVLDEPESNSDFDLDSSKEMFRDWGWAGAVGKKPAWMR